MKFLKFISLISVVILTACHPLQLSQVEVKHIDINQESGIDSNLYYLVEQYKIQLEGQMNIVLTNTPVDLIIDQPSSNLGNMMADVLYNYYSQKDSLIDFAITNRGGIRVSSLAKGPLTMRDVYQLMPFDNEIVLVKISGKTVQQLFQHVCHLGGWPISQADITMDSARVIQKISIKGQDLQEDKIYSVAMNDYIANGGDNCSFLIGAPIVKSGTLYRDAIIDSWKNQANQLTVHQEMRIRYEN